MKIEKFEDLDIWKLSRELYRLTSATLKEVETNDFLVSHIKRTAISISSNIAEGFDRDSHKEFIRFLFIARGSNAEFRSQLYLLLDTSKINPEEFKVLFEKSKIIGAKTTTLIQYLQSLQRKTRNS